MPSDDALVGWVKGYQPHPEFSVLPLRFWKCPKLLELQSHLVQAFVRWKAIECARDERQIGTRLLPSVWGS